MLSSVPGWMKLSVGLGGCALAAWRLADPAPSVGLVQSERAAPELPAAMVEQTPPGLCPAGMAYIPGGELARRHPSRLVESFCMATHEVTVAAYRTCVADGKCSPAAAKRRCNVTRSEVDDHPINCVTWDQADNYCSAHGGRLPTEWEWEWAAQGGAKARTYPWGEVSPGPFRANLCFNECRSQMVKLEVDASTRMTDGWVLTSPVGTYPKGRGLWGLDDLVGNVGEWTSTEVERQEGHYVFRGASWYHHELDDLVERRFHAPGAEPDSAVGFRCAAFPGESPGA